jgi:hypothetical protein
MTDEYFNQIGEIIDAHWTDEEENSAAAWGKTFDAAHAQSRKAWTDYGVDPDDPTLKWRNDGASRIGPNGEVCGGGLLAARWGTTKGWIEKGYDNANIPAGLPGISGATMASQSYHQATPAAAPQDDGGSDMRMVTIFGLFLAGIIALPFMLWIGG